MVRVVAVCGLVALAAGGCAPRGTAYRFRAPLVDGVAAAEIPAATQRVELRSSTRRSVPAAARYAETARGLPRVQPTGPLAKLYALVGAKDKDAADLDLVFRALERLDVALADEVRAATDGAALVAAARKRGALASTGAALGDLVVFDGLQGAGAASLVGVVTSTRTDGTVEFIYRGLGVVRRGYLDLAHPTQKRDRNGRILNSWVRVKRGHYSKGLAGDFFATYIRLDRLTL